MTELDTQEVVAEAQAVLRAVSERRCNQDGLVCIYVNGNKPLRTLAEEAIDALVKQNHGKEFLFQRAGKLVRIMDVEGKSYDKKPTQETIIAEVTIDVLTGMLTNAANFIKDSKHITPPIDIVRYILARGSWLFPVIVGVVSVPTLRPDGTILNRVGYDEATSLVYRPSEDFEMPDIPDEPTEEDVQEAVRLIEEAIGEFPYDSQASKTNAFAGMLTPIVRPARSFPNFLSKPKHCLRAVFLAQAMLALLATKQSSWYTT